MGTASHGLHQMDTMRRHSGHDFLCVHISEALPKLN
jgi:hypothetical protein